MATIKEALRRIYHEIIDRRSRVRICYTEPSTTMEKPPIFIIGIYRSGTTLLRYIIDSHSQICCPPESNFIKELNSVVGSTKSLIGLERMGFEKDHVQKKLREFCIYFFQNYAASCNKPRWADKSPEYVNCLGFIEKLFPEAKFIIIYRHAFDQAHSHTRGGTFVHEHLIPYCSNTGDYRIGATKYWQEKTGCLMDFEEQYADKCMRIYYEQLCENPEAQLKPIFEFIDEPWESDVLKFYEHDHDKGAEDGRVVATRGFSISEGHWKSWPKQLIDQCLQIAEPNLKRLKYV